MKTKKQSFIIFLTVFLSIAGFAITLPLSPALLDYYLPNQEADGGLLGHFVFAAKKLAETLGKENPNFTTAVFFGCLIASIYSFLQFVFSPICGKISDILGRKPVLLVTLAGTTVSYSLWAIAGTFNLFIISRIFAGIMSAYLSVSTAAMADITTKKDRTKGMALVGIGFGMGFILGPAIGGLLTKINILHYYPHLQWLGINPFSVCALFAMILSVLTFFWVLIQFNETLPHEKRARLKTKPKLLNVFTTQIPSIFKTNLSYFIFILAFSGLEYTLAFLATERFSYSPIQIGYLFLYIGFILIFTRGYIIKKLSSIFDERVLGFIGICCGIVAFFTIAFAFKQTSFILGSSFLAFAVALTSTSLSSLVSLYATEQTQGQEIGLFNSAGSLARAIGPLVAALPYMYLGAKGAYLSVSSLLFIPLFIICFLPKPLKVPVTEENIACLKDTEPPSI